MAFESAPLNSYLTYIRNILVPNQGVSPHSYVTVLLPESQLHEGPSCFTWKCLRPLTQILINKEQKVWGGGGERRSRRRSGGGGARLMSKIHGNPVSS